MFFCSRERLTRWDFFMFLVGGVFYFLATGPIYVVNACKNFLGFTGQPQRSQRIQGCQGRGQYQDGQRSRVWQTKRPEHLPNPRTRSLTLPFSPYIPPETNYAQAGSLFFSKLPTELRRMIYREILAPEGGGVLHVATTYGALLSRRCSERGNGFRGWQHMCWGLLAADGSSLSAEDSENSPPHQILGLLCSSRRIYSEAVDILYTDNVISVRQTRTLMDLNRRVLPHRLNMIRHLHLDCLMKAVRSGSGLFAVEYRAPFDIVAFWRPAFTLISMMKGLQDLRVSLSTYSGSVYAIEEDILIRLLTHLKDVRVAKFAVECYWPMDPKQVLEGLDFEAPFTLETKPVWVRGGLSGEYL